MKTEKLFLLALALLFGLVLRSNAQTKPVAPIIGTWLNEAQNRQITFTQAKDQTYTATITWVKPGSPTGAAKLGDVVAKGLKAEKGQYTGGQLYAAKQGRWVNGSARLSSQQMLELKGSVGFMSQTQIWTRVAAK